MYCADRGLLGLLRAILIGIADSLLFDAAILWGQSETFTAPVTAYQAPKGESTSKLDNVPIGNPLNHRS